MLSCGAALNHCVVAFAALGWQSKIRRFPNPADPDHLAVIDSIASGLRCRCRPGCGDPAAPYRQAQLQLVAGAAKRHRSDGRSRGACRRDATAGGRASTISSASWPTRRGEHRTDYDYLTELTTWSGRYASTAGVPARSAPQPDTTAAIPARSFAGAALAQSPDADPTEDNAIVIALGTAEDDTMARLRAGEATSLVLLTATAAGLASCPITEPLEIAETRAEVQADVFGAEAYPQMLLRIGWAPVNADPLPSTPRRDLSEMATRLDGSPLMLTADACLVDGVKIDIDT